MTGYRKLARNHDFTILWIGETISDLGSTMSLFVFPLLGYRLTGSTVVAAVLEAAGLLGMAATLLPAGVMADRHDRRRLMLGQPGRAPCSTEASRSPAPSGCSRSRTWRSWRS